LKPAKNSRRGKPAGEGEKKGEVTGRGTEDKVLKVFFWGSIREKSKGVGRRDCPKQPDTRQ